MTDEVDSGRASADAEPIERNEPSDSRGER
jgi:hypothetical protein